MEQLNQKQAIAMFESKVYENWTSEEIVRFQLFQDRLCMPFDIFHNAMSDVLERPVFTHEFAYRNELTLEYLGEKPSPTFEDIVNLIPKEKRIVIMA